MFAAVASRPRLLGANLEPVILQWSALPRIKALGRLAASWAPLSHATWLRRESSVIIDGRLPVQASGITLNYDGGDDDGACGDRRALGLRLKAWRFKPLTLI